MNKLWLLLSFGAGQAVSSWVEKATLCALSQPVGS